jgi:hypothetical protein
MLWIPTVQSLKPLECNKAVQTYSITLIVTDLTGILDSTLLSSSPERIHFKEGTVREVRQVQVIIIQPEGGEHGDSVVGQDGHHRWD